MPMISFSQYKWDVGVQVGAGNYIGDIGGGAGPARHYIADMKMGETRTGDGLFVRYKMFPSLSIQGGFAYTHVQGSDKDSPYENRRDRNLDFQDNIQEINLLAQYYFFEINDLGHTYRYRNDFRAYAGIGVAGFHFNPLSLTEPPGYGNTPVALEPLQTEGHGYSLYGFAIPAQIGFYFTIEKRYRIGWDITYRTTFTDEIDDVHGNYVDPATLPGGANGKSAAFADRTGEVTSNPAILNNYGWLKTGEGLTNQPGGHANVRGYNDKNDDYLTTTINFSYALRGKSTYYKSHYGSIFKGKKYKKRKFRAKF